MSTRIGFRSALVAVALLQGLLATQAATLYWDADATASGNSTDGTGLGGAGTWSAANSWWNGVDANQAWANDSDAILAGTAGRIQLGANVTAASLQFDVPSYIIDLCVANGGASHFDLTVNGIAGSAASIVNTCTLNQTRAFTINIASGSASWGGTVTGGRLGFTKGGAGTLNMSGKIDLGATYAPLNVTGGRLNLIGNTGSKDTPGYITVSGGAVFDLGDNAMEFRQCFVNADSTVTTSGSGSLKHTSQFNGDSLWGTLSGTLTLWYAHNGSVTHSISGDNTFSGGTLFSQNVNGTCELRVLRDSALGTGRVRMENSPAGNTTTLAFRSPSPVLGSLESANAGVKSVVLGNAGITLASNAMKATWANNSTALTLTSGSATSLAVGQAITSAAGIPAGTVVSSIIDGTHITISQNTTAAKTAVAVGTEAVNTTLAVGTLDRTTDTFGGAVSQASGTTGSVTKKGAGEWILSGANTYTGTTRVEDGTLRVTHATAGLAACKVQVAGGTFAGPASSGTGTITFNLGATADSGIVMTSGALDLSRLALSFSGTPTEDSYTLVDYSGGGTFTGAANPDTANSFASAANVPDGYKWSHDATAKTVTLFLPPAGTMLLLR